MEDTNPSSDTLAGDAQLTSADGGETVDSGTLTLAELNQFLGTDFKEKDTALKSLKDTKNFVGKRKEDIAAEVRATTAPSPQSTDTALASEVQKLKDELFYTQNPEFKGLRDLITSMGANPAEVVGSEAFKNVFEKVKVADEVETKRSVVSSSPRLAQAKSTLDSAIQVANSQGSGLTDVAETLARGLLAGEA
jgi:hypothetical protein